MKKRMSNFGGKIMCFFFKRIPMKEHYIFFESFTGKSYGGNPKYIYEELLKRKGGSYKYIWSMTDTSVKLPGNPIIVKRPNFKYIYYAMVSKYWVSNVRLPKILEKRTGNVYLQTWHGTPLKRIGFDIEKVKIAGTSTNRYRKELTKAIKKWDYLIAPNRFSKKIFKKCFNFNDPIVTGYPRNDLLFSSQKKEISDRVKKDLKISKRKKIILYAPTWRDNENQGINRYEASLKINLKNFKEKLGEDWVILLRCHYIISEKLDINVGEESVLDVSKYGDINELYLIADLLITDYSSVMFDFVNTGKPILFYTYDLESYRDDLRGFYFNFEDEAPGPLIKKRRRFI